MALAMRCRSVSVEDARSDCRVFHWKPSGIISAGHIALELPNKMYISFWPRPKGKKGTLRASGTLYSTVEEEKRNNGEPSAVHKLPGLNCENIVKWWSEFLDNEPHWDLIRLNCSNVVYDALCAGSEWFKNRTSNFLPSTPGVVAELAAEYVTYKNNI